MVMRAGIYRLERDPSIQAGGHERAGRAPDPLRVTGIQQGSVQGVERPSHVRARPGGVRHTPHNRRTLADGT
jgi:hypothetical protein